MDDRIKCLECGKWYIFLPPHLRGTHGMTAEEYRERHGLNMTEPLAGPDYRERASKRFTALGTGAAYRHNLRSDAARRAGYKRRPQTLEQRAEQYQSLHKAGTEAARKVDRIGPRLAAAGPWPATVAEVRTRLGCTDKAARTWLSMCLGDGRLVRLKRGVYALPEIRR